ncbi:MAG TPA: pyrroloquinoline quinone-dependent dehydrogenase [Bryobacteraceae bacterium]|nr:pyrroloquinoline quinone-dependent dehydrogenase [Bryobacteraceae bacterium]
MPLARAVLLLSLPIGFALAQSGTASGEWRYYGGDAQSTKYSPLDQINRDNASKLQVAWTWKAQNFGPRADPNYEVTPLMVHGVLYFTAGMRRDTVAVDATTGETLWMYRFDEGDRGEHAVRFNNRGVAYWSNNQPGGQSDERILTISLGYQLIALNAKTGLPAAGFGNNGIVDLLIGLDRENIKPGIIGATSPAIVVGDTVVVGSALQIGTTPSSKDNVPGYVRGYDVHTGKLLWTFHTIAQPGDFGNETWENGSWKFTGNTAVWAPMSADPELGYVYLPVETPTGDFYGGHRPGDDLFDESLVCVDARTGKRVWHYQIIHHGIWDWDNPAAPVLLDLTVNGQKIKAVAQVTKQAFVYAFDRKTGKPIWPIEERSVGQSDVPGEKTAPTQPFPTKPAAFDRQGVSPEDLIDFTPALKAAALKIASQYKMGPLFTPPSVFDANGKKGTLMLPNATGGANWQGAAADPETGVLYVPSVTNPYIVALVHDPQHSDMNYIGKSVILEKVEKTLPIIKPPYGRITAIDLNSGDNLWMIPNGQPPDDIKNNPALKGIDTSKFGNPERALLVVTKSLLFSADATGLSPVNGSSASTFRAIDKKTGDTIAELKLPSHATGVPMTYMAKGKQYIVIAVGGRGEPAELVALAEPSPE